MTWAAGYCKLAHSPDQFSDQSTENNRDDRRITSVRAVMSPKLVMDYIPMTERAKATVFRYRSEIADIIHAVDSRWLVIVGPCSIHDVSSALDYAYRLRILAEELSSELLVVMRVYFEKPRTTIGWKGMINDPDLDGTSDLNKGLKTARDLLNTMTPQYIGDLVSWAAIGARTAECQLHRELVSSLPMSVGFKNSTSGDVDVAIDGLLAASHPHSFLSISKQGTPIVVHSCGNDDTHLVLRGSKSSTNFQRSAVTEAIQKQRSAGLSKRVMIDCSHGNSQKNFRNQEVVLDTIIDEQLGDAAILGIMLESNIEEGRQEFSLNTACANPFVVTKLKYGQSITDACVGWAQTESMLRKLARALRR